MLRHRLTDEQWDRIADLFPPPKPVGRKPRDRREIVDAIFWILNTGAPWRDLPASFGPWATAWDLFDKWSNDGLLLAILQRLQGEVPLDEELWCIDGTVVRAHKCASGGGNKGMKTSRTITPLAGAKAG